MWWYQLNIEAIAGATRIRSFANNDNQMPVTILVVLPTCSVVAHTDYPQHEWEIPVRKDSGNEV